MHAKTAKSAVRILPENVANKIAAGEVIERPASVVKELVENALDAGATRITVRMTAAGRRTIEVVDDGSGMSEHDAVLAIERHATSKIRTADHLDGIATLGFRGEALPSIAAVSRFELVTRRAEDNAATRVRVEGGVLRDVSQTSAPAGTRVTVNRLYFNTPARAKFLKGVTTELGQAVDIIQRHALAQDGVGFQFHHNEKPLLDIPPHASLRERVALIWGLNFLDELVELDAEHGNFRFHGLIGTPKLTRSQRSHQFFFLNRRPAANRSLQYGFESAYYDLLTTGRHPVGMVLVETHPRFADVNVHPAKREVRFRDERAARSAIREAVRERLAVLTTPLREPIAAQPEGQCAAPDASGHEGGETRVSTGAERAPTPAGNDTESPAESSPSARGSETGQDQKFFERYAEPVQTEMASVQQPRQAPQQETGASDCPEPVYRRLDSFAQDAVQVFDTYLLVPEDDRLLIIDQHALHERLNFDRLREELHDGDYESQQLAVPLVVEVAPSQRKVLETNLSQFSQLGIEIEPFGGNTFQVTALCPLYDEQSVLEAIYAMLDEMAQGDLFERESFQDDLLRLATRACHASVRGGDRLTPQERQQLIEGFHRLRPPYTCPHGRPIVTELTLAQMERSFRRRQ